MGAMAVAETSPTFKVLFLFVYFILCFTVCHNCVSKSSLHFSAMFIVKTKQLCLATASLWLEQLARALVGAVTKYCIENGIKP